MHGGLLQHISPLGHIRERQGAELGHPQRNIQVSQADIAVDAKHIQTGFRQRRGQSRADGSFACSALTGQDSKQFTHETTPLIVIRSHYKGKSHKSKEHMPYFFTKIHRNIQKQLLPHIFFISRSHSHAR